MKNKLLWKLVVGLMMAGTLSANAITTVYAEENQECQTEAESEAGDVLLSEDLYDEGGSYGTLIQNGNANYSGTAKWATYDTTGDGSADLVVISGSGDAIRSSYTDFNADRSSIRTIIVEAGITSLSDTNPGTQEIFRNYTSVTSVTLPNTLTAINESAFLQCSSLAAITLPDSVKTIGDHAFGDCTELKSIHLPSGLTSLGESAFSGCSKLETVEIPGTVDSIKWYAFSCCSNLTTVTINEGVKSIGDDAFLSCFKLEKATIPASVTTMSEHVFSGARNLTIYGYEGSYAQQYAQRKNIPFVALAKKDIPFSDVPTDAYYYEPVKWAYNNNITTGVSATKFGPSEKCSRGQVVTFQWRAAGKPEPAGATNPFADVTVGAYYYKPVLWAVENNITTGVSPNRFAPGNAVSRAQVVTFIWRANGQPDAPSTGKFQDVPATSYYAKAVNWCVSKGITTGTSATTFSPEKDCIRGQIVTFLYRGYAK